MILNKLYNESRSETADMHDSIFSEGVYRLNTTLFWTLNINCMQEVINKNNIYSFSLTFKTPSFLLYFYCFIENEQNVIFRLGEIFWKICQGEIL